MDFIVNLSLLTCKLKSSVECLSEPDNNIGLTLVFCVHLDDDKLVGLVSLFSHSFLTIINLSRVNSKRELHALFEFKFN